MSNPATADLLVCVLGPCVVSVGPRPPQKSAPSRDESSRSEGDVEPYELVELSAIQRKLLARLALARPGSATMEELADAIWGDDKPATAQTSIYNQVSRIRSKVGADLIQTSSEGRYILAATTDVDVVADMLEAADTALAHGRHEAAADTARQAIGYWRGVPYVDLDENEEANFDRQRLLEMRRSFDTIRLEGAIGAGRIAWGIAEAERLVGLTPDDEHRWVLLIRALEISGRRGDALGAYERARRSLAERLGLEPSQALRDAEAFVLEATTSQRPSHSVSLTGRQGAIEAVVSTCDNGGAVVLVGEPGVGKSRVLTEVQRRMRRRGVLAVRSDVPLHADTAVRLIRDLAEGLGEPLNLNQSPVDSFVVAVRRAVASRGRVTLTADDVDRAGPTTVEALRAAAAIDGVSVVVTASDEAALIGWEDWAETVVLEPLAPDELAEFARSALGRNAVVDQRRIAWLVDMSGGNPAFLELLLDDPHWFVQDGERSEDASRADQHGGGLIGSGSPLLSDVVRMRLDRLGHTTRSALEVAAVCGQRGPAGLLVEMVGSDGVDGGVAAKLLTTFKGSDGSDWVAFRHGAVQQVLYRDLSPGRRMEIHYHAAQVLRAHKAPISIIAWHSSAAAEVDPLAAAHDAMAAAAAATDQGAHADAALWYERAIDASRRAASDQRLLVAALIGYGDALRRAGSTEQEKALFSAATAAFELKDESLIAEAAFAVLQLGATTSSGRLHERAIELAKYALEVVEDSDARALIAGGASLAHSMSADADQCRALFLEAIRGATSPLTRSRVLPFAYLGIGHPTDLEMLEAVTSQLLSLAEELDDPVSKFEALQMQFSVALQRCDGDTVRRVVSESAGLIDMIGDVGRRWSLAYQQAAVAFLDGDLVLAEAMAEQAMEVFSSTSPSRAFAAYGGQILMIRIAQGRIAELVPVLEGLLVDQPGVPAWNAALALAIADADPQRARSHSLAALDNVVEDFTWMAAHIIGGRAAARIGDTDLSRRYAERLSPFSGLGCWQGTCSYGPVDTVLWQLFDSLGDSGLAEEHLRRAMIAAEGLGAPLFLSELGC